MLRYPQNLKNHVPCIPGMCGLGFFILSLSSLCQALGKGVVDRKGNAFGRGMWFSVLLALLGSCIGHKQVAGDLITISAYLSSFPQYEES